QWGFELQEVKRQGIDILLAIDVSKSMLTEDVKPNRLERTKLAVKDLIKKLKGDRIGLIGFAGDAFLFCPLTVDYGGFLLSLEDLDVTSVPRGGTNLSQAMSEALKEYENVPAKYKAVVIVTDGENLEGDPLAMARRAKEKGIKVYCVGIGTKEGDLVRVQDMVGGHEFLKDENGNFVKSRLNEDLLQKVALATGGMYVRASGAQFGLDMIYDRELAKMERRDLETRVEKKYFDRFQVPLALALVLLVWETCLVPRKAKFI
ncbi:MAG: VWA domain-containing protein, partial [Candidatus Omnitrophota bacterium]|nr:VWA domain-containing protein [Candidatus Omnitrophota bacterium]